MFDVSKEKENRFNLSSTGWVSVSVKVNSSKKTYAFELGSCLLHSNGIQPIKLTFHKNPEVLPFYTTNQASSKSHGCNIVSACKSISKSISRK
jgi:hypothetical protein